MKEENGQSIGEISKFANEQSDQDPGQLICQSTNHHTAIRPLPFKKLLFNDPIYGFIPVNYEIIFRLIQHPYFQRLRRIHQLGLTYLVFPGAMHTRFQHAMGSMYLMSQAIATLRSKGHAISDEESEAANIAILLHDIGHGPFSHVLENSIIMGVNHELISSRIMNELNKEFDGQLSLAIKIFNNKYRKKFLHQLVSSQLDMDRMDYLKRDSFYAGVSEGIVSWERIIIMLNVFKGELVVEEKGIYPVERFIIGRRLMYWQVYLHKTVLAAEMLLVQILKRAKELSISSFRGGELAGSKAKSGRKPETKESEFTGEPALFATPAFRFFLQHNISEKEFKNNPEALEKFSQLDDSDIFISIKAWASHPDKILSMLCKNMVARNLSRTEIQDKPFSEEKINQIRKKARSALKLNEAELEYFVFHDKITNSAYDSKGDKINILFKDGTVRDIVEASDQSNIFSLAKPVVKYYLCYPK